MSHKQDLKNKTEVEDGINLNAIVLNFFNVRESWFHIKSQNDYDFHYMKIVDKRFSMCLRLSTKMNGKSWLDLNKEQCMVCVKWASQLNIKVYDFWPVFSWFESSIKHDSNKKPRDLNHVQNVIWINCNRPLRFFLKNCVIQIMCKVWIKLSRRDQ